MTKAYCAAPQTKTVLRALQILDCLCEAGEPLSVSDIGRAMSVSRSTVYRILGTLESYGYVAESPSAPEKIQLGPKVLALAGSYLGRLELRELARPHLLRLRDLSQETVDLAVPQKTELVYVDKVESPHPVRQYSVIGARRPMYCTAVGKAILACLPPEESDAILAESTLVKRTANTIIDPHLIKMQLEVVRQQGFALNDVECDEGIRGVGVAVLGHTGRPIAAIAISGPAYRFSLDDCCRLAGPLKDAAAALFYPLPSQP